MALSSVQGNLAFYGTSVVDFAQQRIGEKPLWLDASNVRHSRALMPGIG